MSTKYEVARRVRELQAASPVELKPKQLADALAAEFPDIATCTLERYCCADTVQYALGGGARDYDITVVASDFHVPFHNVPAVENWLAYCEAVQPDNIAINGDFLDCIAVSSFPKPPGVPLMQDEVDAGYTLLSRLRRQCPSSRIYFLEGNHEQRLERLLMREPGLYGLKALSIRALLDLDKLRMSHHPYMEPVQIGSLTVVHGDRVSKHASYSAKATLIDGGFRNVVVGHTHRLGWFNHTGMMGTRRAAEIGGLFDIDQADYIKGTPNWQNGFAVWRESEDFHALELVEVSQSGAFCVGGELYP
jgi:predicted phosphodiesterase